MEHIFHILASIIHFLGHSAPLMFAGAVALPEAITGAAELITEGGGEGENKGEITDESETGAETTESAIEVTEEEKTAAALKDETKVDWRTVPPEVRAHIQTIGKENPKLGNLLQNAVYTSQTFLKEFPGGLKEAQAIKKDLDEIGGLEEAKGSGIKLQQMQEEQEDMDNRARSGDASVLDNLVEIAGDGFHKLMPLALDRWASADAPGYSHTLSKVIVQTMQDSGVVADLNMAIKMLGLNNPDATKIGIEGLSRIAAWANRINQSAIKAPEKPQVDPKIAEQQKDINDQKATLFNQKFSSAFSAWRSNQIQDQLRVIAKDKKFNDYQISMVRSGVINEIKGILSGDASYLKTLEKHYNKGLATNDFTDLLKFSQSRNVGLIPDATKKVYKRLYSDPSKAASAAKGAPKTETEKAAAVAIAAKGTPTAQGWVKVSADKAPRPDEIDNKLTEFSMKFNKQAILKNGKKVFWGDKIPK